MELEERYIKNYGPLLENFIQEIGDLNVNMCPEPFLPVFGKGYEKAGTRIMFMGWETRDAHKLQEYVSLAKENLRDALFWFEEEFDAFDFVGWRSNFGTDFWSFNLKVLAAFHGEKDWKHLYQRRDEKSHILDSFAWANTDSIERFHVTAKGKGVNYDCWNKIKQASMEFDRMNLVLDILEPNILILLCGDEKEESWVLQGLHVLGKETWEDKLWYYKVLNENKEVHIFWTYHPRGMPTRGIEYDSLIDRIITIYDRNK